MVVCGWGMREGWVEVDVVVMMDSCLSLVFEVGVRYTPISSMRCYVDDVDDPKLNR